MSGSLTIKENKKQDSGKGKPRSCSVINVEKQESINKFPEEREKRARVQGKMQEEGGKLKEQFICLRKLKGMDPEHSPRGWSLSVKKRDSPSMELSRLWAGRKWK